MPPLMAGRTQERLGPLFCFVAKKMERSPMMIFRTFCTTNLANKWEQEWIKLFDFDIRFFYGLAFGKTRNSFSAIQAIEGIFRIPSGINIVTDTPPSSPTVFARVIRILYFILPRRINHEAMSIFLKRR